jgi:hypothetical protein
MASGRPTQSDAVLDLLEAKALPESDVLMKVGLGWRKRKALFPETTRVSRWSGWAGGGFDAWSFDREGQPMLRRRFLAERPVRGSSWYTHQKLAAGPASPRSRRNAFGFL